MTTEETSPTPEEQAEPATSGETTAETTSNEAAAAAPSGETGAAEQSADAENAAEQSATTEPAAEPQEEKTAEAETGADSEAEADGEAEEVDPVQAKREELMYLPGDWYVIHSYSGHERRVKANLEQRITSQNMEDYIFQVEVPMETVTELTKAGKKKKVDRVRIPGYVLVRMDMNEASWRVVRDTPAVTGFVGDAYDPFPLTLDEVVSMLTPMWESKEEAQQAQDQVVTAPEITYEVGESVTVKEGPFENMPATVSSVDAAQRKVTLSIMIFERETPIELSFDQIEKID
ncbi:transcription termination/antitermination protein NusG [Gleimia hominis]|uniref:Transcription termination/antitermination protein NusG n=1 Tax=Gleimia hominis TaxID=595468 RepID=A0ABU3I9T3_9ACTO|nr:transcription termination/antitermination protein NusG [Gleimia hominis]MDT3767126.1 transcription termination/antitermination protein NusG [Gleimia hominis]